MSKKTQAVSPNRNNITENKNPFRNMVWEKPTENRMKSSLSGVEGRHHGNEHDKCSQTPDITSSGIPHLCMQSS
jgi:hypothetical protein